MKQYTEIELEVIRFTSEDVITESCPDHEYTCNAEI